jgi:hypothetical protein
MDAARIPLVRIGLCLWLVAASVLTPARAAGPGAPEMPRASAGVWMTVGDDTLDHMRGGFDPGNGLLVSFAITRAVYINGSLVTQTTLDFSHITDLTAVQTAQLGKQLSNLNLVQNGPGNTAQTLPSGASVGTIVQNTLNNQQIQSQTVINASSNSIGMIKNLNTLTTLNSALNAAIGSR